MLAPWKKSYDQIRQHIKKQRHYFANKGPSCQSYGLPVTNLIHYEVSDLKVTFLTPLMKVKEESEKFGLKLNIQKTKIMASGPSTSWQIDGETVEIVRDFVFFFVLQNHYRW